MSRGRKPNLTNVVAMPLHDEPQSVHVAKAAAIKPDWLNEDEGRVWDRIAPELVMLGRLKPHFADALGEYCVVRVRLVKARRELDDQSWEYVTEGRNGAQYKSKPAVAQLNDDWRKWRSLVGEFGLAPAAERSVATNQSDLFDDFDSL
ncbi:MAG: P27 family phage terminase small subunit [Methylomicrobium sp.]|nr:P27 family phage terminase small subunit [Methylomicrobium sp.]